MELPKGFPSISNKQCFELITNNRSPRNSSLIRPPIPRLVDKGLPGTEKFIQGICLGRQFLLQEKPGFKDTLRSNSNLIKWFSSLTIYALLCS